MIKLYTFLKKILMNIFFRDGRVMRIRKGPLKGYRYMVKPDTGFSSILGRWEKKSQIVYQRSIFENFVVFDLGANYGIHSMLYSKLVGEKGKVFAFEPLQGNIADIREHIKLNGIKNIQIVEQAVADKKGTAEFKVAGHRGQGSLIGIGRQTGELVKVDINSLDNFCASQNIYPDFIKIDIEGAEGLALEGFEKSVSVSYPFFAIDLHTPGCDRQVGKFLSDHGYEVYRINDSSAQAMRNWNSLLEKIEKLDEPWPSPNGIWGVIWAVHPSRKSSVQDFIVANT
jgi:FkbM family methyltransferase